MNEDLEHVRCALCGGSEAEVLSYGKNGRQIVKCRCDGLVYMSPRPRTPHLRTFHTSFVRENNLELFDGYRQSVLQREARIIKKSKPSGNLLDIGCATGTLFENFQDSNWRLFGVDTSSLGIGIIRAKYNAQAFCGTLQEAGYPHGFFDVITCLDTLYYCPDPKAELGEVYRILKDDGLLAVEVPGFTYTLVREKGPICWVLDRKWTRGFEDSYHLFYFSPASIRLLLRRAGFHILEMVPEQASRARGGALAALNQAHFALARLLFRASAGRISIAGKELYLATKAVCAPAAHSTTKDAPEAPDERRCLR